MTMNPQSKCFFPTAQPINPGPFAKDSQSESHSATQNGSSDPKEEKYHAGRLKWGKYKKAEQEQKEKDANGFKQGSPEKSQSKKPSNGNSQDNFDFPDGGWVCSQCQNYNFQGRQKCNRCNKSKTCKDVDGKPRHLLRQERRNQKRQVQQNEKKKNAKQA